MQMALSIANPVASYEWVAFLAKKYSKMSIFNNRKLMGVATTN